MRSFVLAAGILAGLAAAQPAAAAEVRATPRCELVGREARCGVSTALSFQRDERLVPLRQRLGLTGKGVQIVQDGKKLKLAVVQNGDGNAALVRQQGDDHTGRVMQTGDDNLAGLIQIGAGQFGEIRQDGVGQRDIVVQAGVRIRP